MSFRPEMTLIKSSLRVSVDALLADLESTTCHISKRPLFLSEDTAYALPVGAQTTNGSSPHVPPAPSEQALNGLEETEANVSVLFTFQWDVPLRRNPRCLKPSLPPVSRSAPLREAPCQEAAAVPVSPSVRRTTCTGRTADSYAPRRRVELPQRRLKETSLLYQYVPLCGSFIY